MPTNTIIVEKGTETDQIVADTGGWLLKCRVDGDMQTLTGFAEVSNWETITDGLRARSYGGEAVAHLSEVDYEGNQ